MKKALLVASILLLAAAGCGVPTPSATPTPAPTPTPLPTDTPTPLPTATITPTPTPDLSAFSLTRLETSSGFALEIPLAFQLDKRDTGLSVADEALIYAFYVEDYDGSSPLEDSIHAFLDSLEDRGAVLTRGEPYDASLAGLPGLALDYAGTLGGSPVEGQALAVSPSDGKVFVAVGMAKTDANEGEWANAGGPVFQQMLETLTFQEPGGACGISTDQTYGYSESNPIKVGGDFLTGPSREQAYLDNLRGPNGELLTYERGGSLPSPSGDSILDVYQVSGPGVDASLYIDMYTFTEPQAPVGFTCAGPFPLSAP